MESWKNILNIYLVGGLEPWNFMTFHILHGNLIIRTGELVIFRGVETTNQ